MCEATLSLVFAHGTYLVTNYQYVRQKQRVCDTLQAKRGRLHQDGG